MEDKIRNISCNEQLYLDMQDVMGPFSIQFILEYIGKVDKDELEEAVNFVLKNTNDNNLKLKGREWVKNSEKVQIKEVEIKSKVLTEDDFFKRKTDYRDHSLEVYLVKHFSKNYIIIKLLHSVSDGKGALCFVNNLFKKLKNEELIKCDNTVNEQEKAKDICKYNKNIKIMPKYKFNHKLNTVKKYEPKWNIISIKGYHQGVIGKIANILKKEFKDENVSFMIPVDIRRHLDNENYLGNMTLPIFLNANKEDTWQDINGKLLYSLKNKEELNKKSLQYMGYQKLPYFVRKNLIKSLMKYLNITKKFTMGAIISYLGRIDVSKYSNDKFQIVDFISLPLQQPGCPFSMVIAEVNNKTNIAISIFKEQIDEEVFDKISNTIKEKLEYEVYENINETDSKKIEDCLEAINMQIKSKNKEIVVDDYNNKYTYNDLDNMSDYICSLLNSKKIQKQDTVIIYMKRSFEFIASVIACMKKNVSFIPVDELTNTSRVLDIIEDSKCKAILLNDLDIDTNIEKIRINSNYDKTNIDNQNQIIEHNENDIVYKIYTSGTTGKPKGIEISYKNLSNYLTWAKETYITKKKLVMPLFTSLSVDLTMTSVFLPIVCGGKINVLTEQFSTLTLDKILNDKEISIIKATPSHLSLVGNKYHNEEIEKIIVGGENFSSKSAENICECFNKEVVIYNEYGPTETTIGCIYEVFKKNKFTNVPIGKCINNMKAYLINDDNEIILSENVEGEIIIGGVGVSQGLINKKSDTLINFNDELFYKSGDYGFIKNGILHCLRKNE